MINQSLCLSNSPGRVWVNSIGCIGFAYVDPEREANNPLNLPLGKFLTTDEVANLQKPDWLGINYNAAIINALDCIQAGSKEKDSKGNPTVPSGTVTASLDGIDLKNPGAYPKCLWNYKFSWINEGEIWNDLKYSN